MNQIRTFANELVQNDINLTLDEYIEEIFVLTDKRPNELIMPKITKMIQWIYKDDFLIEQTELVEFDILKASDMETIQKYFDNNSFEPNIDYEIRDSYYLTPNAFKICLIRSFNCYARYYLFLEDCVRNYNDYQQQLIIMDLRRSNEKYRILHEHMKEVHQEICEYQNDKRDFAERVAQDIADKLKELTLSCDSTDSENSDII